MAHTDSCKIQVIQFTKKLVNNGMSISKACQETERETDGIPAETIRRWWKDTTKEDLVIFDQLTETPEITDASGGDSGDIFPTDPVVEAPKKTADIIKEIHKEVTNGTPLREATRKAAEESGKKPETLRRAYLRKQKQSESKQEPPVEEIVSEPQPEEETPVTEEPQAENQAVPTVFSHAMQFVTMAISQLKRIRKNDPNKEMAFNKVREFLNQNS